MDKKIILSINFFGIKEKDEIIKFDARMDDEEELLIQEVHKIVGKEFYSIGIPFNGIVFDGEDILSENWKCWTDTDEDYCNFFNKKFDKNDDYISIKRI